MPKGFLEKTCLTLFLTLFAFTSANSSGVSSRETPIVKVVKDTAASVVNISTEHIVLLRQSPHWGIYGNDFDLFFNQFSASQGMASALKLKSVGSGVIIDESGLIVTNAHVVNMASNIFVILNNGAQVKGEVVFENRDDDLAFIKITPPEPLLKAVLGQTKDLMLGETVVAIGNPLGLENTVTSGILSGKNRRFHSPQGEFIIGDMLQIDAPINPGNSGGALFNLNGELIGINVAVVQYSQSIGFSVPVERLKMAIQDYKNNKGLTEKAGKQNGVFDIEEAGNEYILKLKVADLDQNKVKVEVKNGLIVLSGEYSSRREGKTPGSYQSSLAFGSFVKTVPLPQDADPGSIKTEVKGDTLVIRILKKTINSNKNINK